VKVVDRGRHREERMVEASRSGLPSPVEVAGKAGSGHAQKRENRGFEKFPERETCQNENSKFPKTEPLFI
jgi:hypothetical protein